MIESENTAAALANSPLIGIAQGMAEKKVKSFLTPGDVKPKPEAKPEGPQGHTGPEGVRGQPTIRLDADFKKVTDGIVGALVGNTGKTLMEVIETSNEKLITAIESIQPSTVAMVAPGGQQIQMPAGTGPNTSARKLNV